jgi:hypothetical protein
LCIYEHIIYLINFLKKPYARIEDVRSPDGVGLDNTSVLWYDEINKWGGQPRT